VKQAAYYRAWTQVSDPVAFPDADVIFHILHSYKPAQRAAFDRMFISVDYREGTELMGSGCQFDWSFVKNNTFVSRNVADINDLIFLVREKAKIFVGDVPEHPIVINGKTYTCVGGSEGSAKLLFTILTLSVSVEQIAVLRQDIRENGILSMIMFDPNYKIKIEANRDSVGLCRTVLALVAVFKTFFNDDFLCFSSAILVVSHLIDEKFSALFSVDSDKKIASLAVAEFENQAYLPMQTLKGPTIVQRYHDESGFLKPWEDLPLVDETVATFATRKFTIDKQHDQTASELSDDLNSALLSFDDLNQGLVTSPYEALGSTIILASTDFIHDIPYTEVDDLCNEVASIKGSPTDVIIVGSNRKTRFQHLALSKAARLITFRKESTGFFDSITDIGDSLVYTSPQSFFDVALLRSPNAVLVSDTVSHFECKAGRNTYLFNDPHANNQMARAFELPMFLYNKMFSETPDSLHSRLPAMMVIRFVPFVNHLFLSYRDFMMHMQHHYDVRFYPPCDLNGLGFTIVFKRWPKMLPKIHIRAENPIEIFQRMAYETLVVRYTILSNMKVSKFSWRALAPLRGLSRHYGALGKMKTKRVSNLVDFADWGKGVVLNDFNNIFSGHMNPTVFESTRSTLGLTAVARRNAKKHGINSGVSVLDHMGNSFNKFMDTISRPVSYTAATIDPLPQVIHTGNPPPKGILNRRARKAESFG